MSRKILITILHDLSILCISFFVALILRLDFDKAIELMSSLWYFCLVYALINISILHYLGLYHGIWRYASLHEIISIFKSITVSTLIIIFFFFLIFRLESIPRSFPVLLFIVSLLGITGPRIFYRFIKDKLTKKLHRRIPVIIVGDGNSVESFIRLTKNEKSSPYDVIAIMGKKTKEIGRRIHNIPIIASINDDISIEKILKKENSQKFLPRRIIITDQSLSAQSMEKLYVFSKKQGLALGVLPKVSNFSLNTQDKFITNPIAIEDVLGRKQRVHNPNLLKEISGKSIIITGAGGSIGSEVCHQLSALSPKKLILIEENEYALYKVSKSLTGKFIPYITDIRDTKKIEFLIKKYKPDIIFHAAALKHITFVEDDPIEAIKTNFFATVKLCHLCKTNNVSKFVFISTDKAVNPSNIMGASKRLCEKYIQNFSLSSPNTKFSIVRFGNVLGSTGSVVPLFEDQIKKGGPITITHPKVQRYFMTIREAVELVLISSQIKNTKNGEIFILEMGDPVFIKDLADRMILLSGKNNKNIKIEYTGIRKGEKISEELFFKEEKVKKTKIDGILSTTDRIFKVSFKDYDKLISLIEKNKFQESINLFTKLLPEMQKNVKN